MRLLDGWIWMLLGCFMKSTLIASAKGYEHAESGNSPNLVKRSFTHDIHHQISGSQSHTLHSSGKVEVKELNVFLSHSQKKSSDLGTVRAISNNIRTRRGASSLVFVFDTTGSMYPDLVQAIGGAAKILATALARPEKPIYNYILVPFKDPEIGPVTVTKDPEKFQRTLRELYVQGGGDCPETSINAIKTALEKCLPNSFIYVFTDASAKDYYLTDQVLALIQEKQSQVVFVLTGICNGYKDKGYLVYERIAAASSGQVFNLKKGQVKLVLDFVRVSLQATKVYLATVDRKHKGTYTMDIPVDKELTEVTISVSGGTPKIKAISPSGKIMHEGKGLKVLLNLKDASIVILKRPKNGMWKISVTTSSRSTIRITGLSRVNFYSGFTVHPTSDIYKTFSRPIMSFKNYLLIITNELDIPGKIEEVYFMDYHNDVLLKKTASHPQNSSYIISDIAIPKKDFFIRISGTDHAGYKFFRSTPTALSPIKGPPPKITMLTKKDVGILGKAIILICTVKSVLPYDVTWFRNARTVGKPRHYSDSMSDRFVISKLKFSDAGKYSCKAVSKTGSDLSSIELSVNAPPPKLLPEGIIFVAPGNDATLLCAVAKPGKYKYQWFRFMAESLNYQKIESHHRINADGSLLLRNVVKRMVGTYVCRVSNNAGHSEVKVTLMFYGMPQVKADKPRRSYRKDSEVNLRCSSSSKPPVTFTWIHNGGQVSNDHRLRLNRDGSLTITKAVKEDQGLWQCKGTNVIGSDTGDINLLFLQKPTVHVTTQHMVVELGKTVALECHVTGSPRPKVTWFRHGSKKDNSHSPEDNKLIIFNVKETDEGSYQCNAANEAGSARGRILLSIGVVPKITSIPGNKKAKIYSNIVLVCKATGKPKPVIKWSRVGGKHMPPSRFKVDRNGYLRIQKIMREDEGVYTCEARNMYGEDQENSYIEITGAEKPRFLKSRVLVKAKSGDKVSMRCDVIAGVPTPHLKWYSHGKEMRTSGRIVVSGDQITIARTEEADEGEYVCVATNLAGTATRVTTLQIRAPPRIEASVLEFYVRIGESIQLPCKVNGDPRPTVSWKKDGRELPKYNGNYIIMRHGLKIIKASKAIAGEYICFATNLLGSVNKRVILYIRKPPRILDDIHELSVRLGQQAELPCTVEKVPALHIEWWLKVKNAKMIENEKVHITKEGSLVFKNAVESDDGIYECVVWNRFGKVSKLVRLEVTGIMTMHSKEPSVIAATIGQRVELYCDLIQDYGTDEIIILWKHNLKPLHFNRNKCATERNICLNPQTGSLNIPVLQLVDQGTYTCHTHTHMGVSGNSIQLFVHVPPRITSLVANTAHPNLPNYLALDCFANGSPHPEIKWFRGSELLVGQMNYYNPTASAFSSLVLKNLNMDQPEAFFCMAKNLAGYDIKKYTVNTQRAPRFTESIGINADKTRVSLQITSQIGIHVILWCNVTGIPEPNIVWLKNGKKLHSCGPETINRSIQNDYHFTHYDGNKHIDKEMHRIYLDNHRPVDTHLSSKDKFYKPLDLFHRGPRRYDNFNEHPKTTYLKGYSFSHHRMDILRMRSQDNGKYVCVATNSAGRAIKTIDINLNVRPYFNDGRKDSDIITVKGKPVTLKCPTSGFPPPKIIWYKDGKEIHENDQNYEILSNGASLTLLKTGFSVMGNYKCTAVNAVGSIFRKFHVKHLDGPRIKSSHEITRITVMEGSVLSLKCDASGYPAPRISWFKSQTPIEKQFGNSFEIQMNGAALTVANVRLTHQDEYTCKAVNEIGSAIKHYVVTVLVHIKLDRHRYVKVVTVLKGFPVVLNCFISQGRTKRTQIVWFKNGSRIKDLRSRRYIMEGPNGGTLKIAHPEFTDQGPYSCKANNEFSEDSLHFIVKVLDKPRIKLSHQITHITVKEGSVLIMKCYATGIPVPRISWFKGHTGLKEQFGNSLEISRNGEVVELKRVLRRKHQGEYTCKAVNQGGQASKRYIVTVLVPIKIDRNHYLEFIKIKKGRLLVLDCFIAEGLTKETRITWFRNDRNVENLRDKRISLEVEHKTTLKISSVDFKDQGSYTCRAKNEFSEDTLKFRVEVIDHPRIKFSHQITRITVNEGSVFTMKCEASGHPTPRISWFKEQTPLEKQFGSSLEIRRNGAVVVIKRVLKRTHQGRYQCKAVNEAGSASKVYVVAVLDSIRLDRSRYVREITILKGNSLVLNCLISKGKTRGTSIKWLKDGKSITYSRNRNLRLGGPSKGILKISHAVLSDKGTYVCHAKNEFSKDSLIYHVKVLDPVKIYVKTSSKGRSTTIVRKTFKLICDAHGWPTPAITWYFNHEPIDLRSGRSYSSSPDKKQLIIHSALPKHKGTYTCKAKNVAGSDQRDFYLEVYGPPRINKLHEDITVNKGSTVNFHCQATGIPKPTIKWYNSHNKVLSSTHQMRIKYDELWLESVKMSAAGTYYCEAVNMAGKARKTIKLTVYVPPSIDEANMVDNPKVALGRLMILECPAEGHPPPKVTWTFNNHPLSLTNTEVKLEKGAKMLRIERVKRVHEGSYTCIVKNKAGMIRKTFKLEVLLPATIKESDRKSEIFVVIGKMVELVCEAEGKPAPTFMWLKDGVPTVDIEESTIVEHGNKIVIKSVKKSDSGKYTCIASNQAGQQKKIFVLIINVPVSIANGGHVNIVLEEGKSLELSCDARGSPRPEITWYKNGVKVDPRSLSSKYRLARDRSSFSILSSSSFDSGAYKCVVQGKSGRAEKLFTVKIEVHIVTKVKKYEATVKFYIGKSAKLICDLNLAGAHVKWYKGRTEIMHSNNIRFLDHGKILQFVKLSRHDEGEITCMMGNSHHKLIKQFKITLLDMPHISIIKRSYIGKVGLPLVLVIHISGHVKTVWLKDGRHLHTNVQSGYVMDRQGSLHITKVKSSDAGVYMIKISNEAGSFTEEIKVLVEEAPNFEDDTMRLVKAAERKPVRMECKVRGYPRPEIHWERSHQTLHNDRFHSISRGGVLTIKSVRKSDSGIYVCKARNKAGTAMVDFMLKIYGGPVIKEGRKNIEGAFGREMVLACRASGDPVPSVRWKKDGMDIRLGGRIKILTSGWLVISNAQTQDSGTYRCIAENRGGSDHVDIVATVKATVTLRVEGEASLKGSLGGYVKFVCRASHHSRVVWSRMGHDITEHHGKYSLQENGEVLVISALEKEDVGAYKCSSGSESRDLYIIIQSAPTVKLTMGVGRVVEAGKLEVLCQVAAASKSQFKWFINGKPFADVKRRKAGKRIFSVSQPYMGQSKLLIDELTLRDAGTYKCVASNEGGASFAETHVTIEGDSGKACREAECQYKCHKTTSGTAYCLCPHGFSLTHDHKTCLDTDECKTGIAKCKASEKCFNTKGSYRCIDVTCPNPYKKEKATGLCVHKCNTANGLCREGNHFYRDILHFMFITIYHETVVERTLFKISAYDEKGRFLPGATFALQNNGEVPFRIRKGADSKAEVYAVKALRSNDLHSLMIKAVSNDLDRKDLVLKTTFYVSVAISEFDF